MGNHSQKYFSTLFARLRACKRERRNARRHFQTSFSNVQFMLRHDTVRMYLSTGPLTLRTGPLTLRLLVLWQSGPLPACLESLIAKARAESTEAGQVRTAVLEVLSAYQRGVAGTSSQTSGCSGPLYIRRCTQTCIEVCVCVCVRRGRAQSCGRGRAVRGGGYARVSRGVCVFVCGGCVRAWVHAWVCACMCALCAYVHVHLRACMCVCVCVCAHARMLACMGGWVSVCVG